MAGWRGSMAVSMRAGKSEVSREAGRQYPSSCCSSSVSSSLTVSSHRYSHVFMVFWSLSAGIGTFYFSLGPDSSSPNVFFPIQPRTKRQEAESFPSGRSCAVCGKTRCKRHRPTSLSENQQPWLDSKVPSKVDASVAEVFQSVSEKFVYPWYRDITEDEACSDEARTTFRFFASVSIRRAQKVDVPAVFADKVMKAVIKHVEIVAKARAKVGSVEDLQQAASQEYGGSLHAASRSRRDELSYSRKSTETLFSYSMPPRATDCRSSASSSREVMAGSVISPTMDFMADPDTVNHMVSIFVDDSPPEPATEPPSPSVPFSQKFTSVSSKKPSVSKSESKDIREQQDLLFRFLNFSKQEGAVHVSQFCSAVEEFNNRISSPESSDAESRSLHGDVVHIYETYCVDQSVDKIGFDPNIVEEIRNVAAAPYSQVVRSQKMTCSFEAYEHVSSSSESVFTPMFCHSDEYFRHSSKGAESPTRNSRISRNPSRRGESFGISRIGSRIKGVFRSTTTDGASSPPSAAADMEDDAVEEATVVVEDDAPAEPAAAVPNQRDSSAWSVSMPFVDLYEDGKREKIPVFCIDVKRNDRKDASHEAESWSVYRRYSEFYVSESRLTEFHGAFPDAQSPSKRLIGPKNYEFSESKREEFEEYLQKSSSHPELRNSQSSADFSSPSSSESQFSEKVSPDLNSGKIFKSVPGKSMKEKGQNSEPFIQSFFNSCESPRPKPSRPESTIVAPSAENKKLLNQLYGNNADSADAPDRKHNSNCFSEKMESDGMYDYMMYVGRVVFRIPDWSHHSSAAGRISFKNTMDACMDQNSRSKSDSISQEHRSVSLITQLRDAVFCENQQERTAADKKSRAEKTREEMMRYSPDVVVKILGEDSRREGVESLFHGLQQPLLNKQMTYVSSDIAISELFPELNKEQKDAFIV